jgi:hypothetical protein
VGGRERDHAPFPGPDYDLYICRVPFDNHGPQIGKWVTRGNVCYFGWGGKEESRGLGNAGLEILTDGSAAAPQVVAPVEKTPSAVLLQNRTGKSLHLYYVLVHGPGAIPCEGLRYQGILENGQDRRVPMQFGEYGWFRLMEKTADAGCGNRYNKWEAFADNLIGDGRVREFLIQ